MVKKLTAYLFVLFANLVILAHAVLPHHHHHEQICIEYTHCIGHDKEHHHQPKPDENKRGCRRDTAVCVLKQAFVIPSSQGRISKAPDHNSYSHHNDLYAPAYFGNIALQPVLAETYGIPKLPPEVQMFATPTHGLRAPPLV